METNLKTLGGGCVKTHPLNLFSLLLAKMAGIGETRVDELVSILVPAISARISKGKHREI